MKKRYIFLIVLCLLFIILVWACSCKKTKALENPVYANSTFTITASDSNSGAVFYYIPTSLTDNQNDLLQINYTTVYSSGWIRLLKYSDANTDGLFLYFKGNNDPLVEMSSISYRANKDRLCYYYIVIGSNHSQSGYNLVINYGYVYYNGISFNDVNAYCYFNNINGQYYDDINAAYLSSNGLSINAYYYNSIYHFNGAINGYIYDVLDYSDTFSEYVDDVKSDYLSKADSISFINSYNTGYSAGEQQGLEDGYTAGYSAGQTAGYNSGYTAGYSAGQTAGYIDGYSDGETYGYGVGRTEGYDEGYADGLADNAAGQTAAYNHGYDAGYGDGYRYGHGAGFEEGFSTGYDRGLAAGMAGTTPMSQATTLIGSIFTGIGSILSIQLFPGFPLGLLILVPLFFSVLGLILWIWRRN